MMTTRLVMPTNSLTFPAGTTGPQTIDIDVVGDTFV